LLGRGRKPLEAFITVLVGTVALCFLVNLVLARPDMGAVGAALIPRAPLKGDALAIAVGILGATVMPHNLYLHSALARGPEPLKNDAEQSQAVRSGTVSTIGALSAAFFVNAAILVLAATVFFPQGQIVSQLEEAHKLLGPTLGPVAPILFGIALLAAGQSSTITGTLAGQIVMEGFVGLKLKPHVRRFVTRAIAIVPAMILVTLFQGRDIDALVVSQIVLSLQLPFAVFPLVWLCSRRDLMGRFASPPWLTAIGYVVAVTITGLNANLLISLLPNR
ncbi:divalent metal cation transporter, partial [bacterium]